MAIFGLEQARFAVQLAKDHPEVSAHRTRFAVRIAQWRILSALGHDAVVPFLRYGVQFYCPSEWHGMSKMAYALRDGYEPELMHLRRWVRPGDVAIDVGAHYGAYTVALASIAGHVHAIEPSQHALTVLEKNIRLNQLSNVAIHPCALGAFDGIAALHHHRDHSRASLNGFEVSHDGFEDVQIRRLDDLVAGQVNFIKIDIEGFELPALEGSTRILSEQHPTVLFELQPDAARRGGLHPYGAWHFLQAVGYRFEQLRPDGSQVSLRNPGEVTNPNVLAIW